MTSTATPLFERLDAPKGLGIHPSQEEVRNVDDS
jgi:hypothetical protein